MKGSHIEDTPWLSLADMMTALMVIFMFVAINYIVEVIEYKFVENDIFNALKTEFEQEQDDEEIELGPDGTVRFNPKGNKNLFELNSYSLTSDFEYLLDEFIPRYLEIIQSENYLEFIKEIRIEGHTDNSPPLNGEDSYSYNLELSSKRAATVLNYIRRHPSYITATELQKKQMDFLFTAIGFSYSRALNRQGEYVYLSSDKQVNDQLSRRVEFRIITSNDELANKIFEETLKE